MLVCVFWPYGIFGLRSRRKNWMGGMAWLPRKRPGTCHTYILYLSSSVKWRPAFWGKVSKEAKAIFSSKVAAVIEKEASEVNHRLVFSRYHVSINEVAPLLPMFIKAFFHINLASNKFIRAHARNVSFVIFLRWKFYQVFVFPNQRRSTVSLTN